MKMDATNFELHPLCTLFPRMSGYEFDCLKLDIKENGQREPIITHDGMILDGGNRYRACIDLGIEPAFMRFSGGSIATYVLSANLHRRHLTPGQQAAIVACVQDWAKAQVKGGDRGNQHTGGKVQRCTLAKVEDRAAQSGASIRTQKAADKVAKADPKLAAAVGRGEISLPKAEQQISPKKVKAAVTPEPEYDPREDELAEAHDTVKILAEENAKLKDAIAVGNLPAPEQAAGEIIAGLRAEVKTLTATLEAVTTSRDHFQREAAAMKVQLGRQRKEIDKLKGGKKC